MTKRRTEKLAAERIMHDDELHFWAEAEKAAKGKQLPHDAFERMCEGTWFGDPDDWGSAGPAAANESDPAARSQDMRGECDAI